MIKTSTNTYDTGLKVSTMSFKAPQIVLSAAPSGTGSDSKTPRKDWTRYADSRLKQFCSR